MICRSDAQNRKQAIMIQDMYLTDAGNWPEDIKTLFWQKYNTTEDIKELVAFIYMNTLPIKKK